MVYGKGGRVGLMDELRGLSILLMVLYHGAYDLVYLLGWNIPLFHHPLLANFLQPFFAGVFVVVSGMACRFSSNNLWRGIVTLTLGAVMSAVTLAFLPNQAVRFGILHLLGLSMLLYVLIDTLLDRLPPWGGAGVLAGLFALTYWLPRGWLGPPALGAALPGWLYTHQLGYLVGLPSPDFSSVDYFPLIPWVFLFLAGACLGRPLREGRAPGWVYPLHSPLLAAVGRHTLVIYLLHQPLLYGLLWAVTRLLEALA